MWEFQVDLDKISTNFRRRTTSEKTYYPQSAFIDNFAARMRMKATASARSLARGSARVAAMRART